MAEDPCDEAAYKFELPHALSPFLGTVHRGVWWDNTKTMRKPQAPGFSEIPTGNKSSNRDRIIKTIIKSLTKGADDPVLRRERYSPRGQR